MIDGIKWVGSVEIHVKASEWFAHKHDNDKAYDNTILHVVWEADSEIKRHDGTTISTLSLKNKVDPIMYDNYRKLVRSAHTIPCAEHIQRVDRLLKIGTLDKVLMERLIQKTKIVMELLQKTNGDWEEATYQLIARNFGFKVNNDQFLRLSKSVPLKVIVKSRDIMQTEALLFGQAGFLDEDHLGEYGEKLSEEYSFLAHKYTLTPTLSAHQWKFMRMRPANFPTIRIAQLGKLLFDVRHLFSWLIETKDYKEIAAKLSVKQSNYWLSHYQF